MKQTSIFKSLRFFIISLLCVFSASVFTSCENSDEPMTTIDYYVSIESKALLHNSADPRGDQMVTVTNQMNDAIFGAYPIQTSYGNDAGVLQACDEAYNNYRKFYPSGAQSSQCVLKLYRARMEGGVIKQSVALKSYSL